jgi:hypothetical protein
MAQGVVMSGSSSHSVVEISRSKKRYQDQDALLKAFTGCPGYTAKEVAVEVLDWKYEPYANSPKRAFDLQRLGYLELLPGRECRRTGKIAHTYRMTVKGNDHLRRKGVVVTVVNEVVAGDHPVVDVRLAISGIRALLGDG